ncbi:MAG TPA: branched-chain amino acid ABC transporter permease [Bradyrhizobium sp.]|uniref:branched-chain amino acid ABC transporter permease n=1 Tax=Bradyrhizobium sp. TaxID=376 RepID=UPI002CC8C3C2|nr:branched-chain amino acid ABC transporter permease [Bradyrhizobium sp.]HLZ03117.1 branched-chain amino acid ABC transporter permease [Bradyrhizobium sp.]
MHYSISRSSRFVAEHAAQQRRQLLVALAVFAAIALLPWMVSDVYLMNVLVLTLLYAALSQSWNLLGGYCGQISLGHALYFGVGAYATSVTFVKFGILPWAGMFLGGAIASVIALALGYPCFRLKGHYFSIATIVIAEIGLLLVNNWNFVGAALGVQWPVSPDSWWTLQFARTKIPYFYVALAMFAATWLVTFWIVDSKWGYAWRAVKDSPEAAESLGVTVFHTKMAAAAISAFFTALGGGFFAAFVSYIDPESVMQFQISLLMALPAVLGGIGSLWGPAIGALILIPLAEFSRSYLGGSGSGIDLAIYGGLIMIVALISPDGITGLYRRLRSGAAA